ncbi:MAG: PEP-CTERM sorting domain-containing protein [Planctomycetota bacterium]
MNTSKITAIAMLLALAVSANPLSAGTVLFVEVDGTSTIVIRATGASSLVDDSSTTASSGVSLLDLFPSGFFPIIAPFTAGDLAVNGTTYPNVFGNLDPPLSARDLNIASVFQSGPQQFTTTAPAFTGLLDVELFTTNPLPVEGTVGNVIVGDGQDGSGAVIGQFIVVPEPTSLTLLGLTSLLVARRRRSRA